MKKRIISMLTAGIMLCSMFGSLNASNAHNMASTVARGATNGFLYSSVEKLVNKCPYLWGGTSAAGCDCSGLVWYLYYKTGPKIYLGPEQSSCKIAQYLKSKNASVAKFENLKPFDLIFYDLTVRNDDQFMGIDHVAIYYNSTTTYESRPNYGVVKSGRRNKNSEKFFADPFCAK